MLEKIFRDPVHNDIVVTDPIIYDLINTKEFQRLRRIKQLGTTGYTFHGGEHSRFSHSLGVYHIASQMVDRFEQDFPDQWPSEDSRLTKVAALLHDVGHGAYSHTFERLFDTDHEAFTQEIITNPRTDINQVLRQVAPDFPEKVAAVINHTYPNKQVEGLISSQIDADRMDYLLRDSYFTGVSYGQFDLTRILATIQPHQEGILFDARGMHAVEDYLVRRYQMYLQVYFHPASRAMEVLLQNLLKRAKVLYPDHKPFFQLTAPHLVPFFEQAVSLTDYLKLDDGVMNSYFQNWLTADDDILADLSSRFINRRVFKSITFDEADKDRLAQLRQLIAAVGFDPNYYTATHYNFDIPYDIYRSDANKPRTEILIHQKDGSRTELSQLSPLVSALTGNTQGDRRFYFPKDMLDQGDLFAQDKEAFQSLIANKHFTPKD